MPICTRNGCKKEFTLEQNNDGDCVYHPGGPVFHEGLKSWSCCSDINKPELDFDEFMKIKARGCQTGKHTSEGPKPAAEKAPTSTSVKIQATLTEGGKEVFATKPLRNRTATPQARLVDPRAALPAPPPPEEEDDPSVEVKPGTRCKRRGCNAEFISNEKSRLGDGENTVCIYHPSQPIFHEGSKGYLCCKRRVLEFDEFLKIEGCKKGRHLFALKKPETEEIVADCRIDHYQTPKDVNVSVFAKQTDKEKSIVKFEEDRLHLDLVFSCAKRFRRTLLLYGPIVPEESKYTIMSTKVELLLRKKDARSWNLLEQTDREVGPFNLTFGVGGRTGTIGGRELILDENNAPRA